MRKIIIQNRVESLPDFEALDRAKHLLRYYGNNNNFPITSWMDGVYGTGRVNKSSISIIFWENDNNA